jgi:hypothetical protein
MEIKDMKLATQEHHQRLVDNQNQVLYVFYSDEQNEVFVAEKHDSLFPCHEAKWKNGGLELTTSAEWLVMYPRVTVWFEVGDLRKSVIAFASLLGMVAAAAE